MKKYYFSILILVMFYQTTNSLENTSYRIQTLGSEFQGIIDDEYTDILANPARLNTIDKKQINVKATKPLTVGWVSNGFSCFFDETGSARKFFAHGVYTSDYGPQTLYQSWQVDVLLMKNFNIKKIPFGAAVQVSDTGEINKYQRFFDVSGQLEYRDETITKDFNTNLKVGFYLQKENNIKEFIISSNILLPYMAVTKQDTFYYYSTNRVIETINHKISVGNGFEYHNRNRKNNVQTGFIIGYVYEPINSKTEDYSTSGNRILYSSPTVNDGCNLNLYSGVGKSIIFLDNKLLFAFACRLNINYQLIEGYGNESHSNGIVVWDCVKQTQNGGIDVSLPAGVEYLFSRALTLRMGLTYGINLAGDTLYYYGYDEENVSVLQKVNFRLGFGLDPINNLKIDFLNSDSISDLNGWKVQVGYSY